LKWFEAYIGGYQKTFVLGPGINPVTSFTEVKLYLSSSAELLQTVSTSASVLCSGLKEQSLTLWALHIWISLLLLVKPHYPLRIGMF